MILACGQAGKTRGAIGLSLTFLFLGVYPGEGRGVKAKRKIIIIAVRKRKIASRLAMTVNQ